MRSSFLRLLLLLFSTSVPFCTCVDRIVKKAAKDADGAEDVHSLYKVAKTWLQKENKKDAWDLLHYLATDLQHIPSMAKLGHHYAELGDTKQALVYFQTAGENGPHHASLLNAGRLLVDESDWVGAMAYLKAGCTLHLTHPKYAQEKMTQVSTESYEIVSRRASEAKLTIEESADVFLYGSLQELPDQVEELWKDAISSLIIFNSTFVKTDKKIQDEQAMKQAVSSLRPIWEQYSSSLSSLQAYLVLNHINDMMSRLAGLDDAYLPMAAGYAEALAASPYCYERITDTKTNPACFNGAAASAMSYYRRASDSNNAKRTLDMARAHPLAATHWDSILQTPLVYNPALKSKPWWNPSDFEAVMALTGVYHTQKDVILRELQTIKNLETSKRGVLHRILALTSRTESSETATQGAGGWSEFGPLFDGTTWHKENCKLVPTICNALQDDKSLCRGELCGSDTIVTINRLRPGTTILPHCGTTNSRLVMHFALEGADGVEFTVGEKMVKSYGGGDGHAIVIDNSFETSVYHGGAQDRFVVVAVLAHPELARNNGDEL